MLIKLEILFTTVYGKSTKSNELAIQLYEMVRNYLEDARGQDKCIFQTKRDRDKILKHLPASVTSLDNLISGSHIKFLCEFGCAILFTKKYEQSTISVTIIYPDQWTSGTHTCYSLKYQYIEPRNQSSLHNLQISQYDTNLNSFIKKFQSEFDKKLKQKRHEFKYSVMEVEEIVKLILKEECFNNYYQITLQEKQYKKKNKASAETFSESFQLLHSQANTAWYVTQAVLRYVVRGKQGTIQTRAKCQELITGFKLSVLEKAIIQQSLKAVDNNVVIKFKKCLNEIIFLYKSNVSPHSSKSPRFQELVKNVERLIVKLKGGRLKLSVEDKRPERIEFDPEGIVKLVKPTRTSYLPIPLEDAQIQQYSYKVSSRLPFQSLLKMYEKHFKKLDLLEDSEQKQEKVQEFLNHWTLLVEKTLFELAYTIEKKDQQNDEDLALYLEQNEISKIIDLDIHMREIQCQFGASNLCKLVMLYQEVVTQNFQHYGMGLKGQTVSHVELIKAICSVIAFQSVKMNRQLKNSSLNPYKIPINVFGLYKNFISHSYIARRAMISIYRYQKKRENLKELFKLDGSCQTFKQFGELVGQQTRSCHVWVSQMQHLLEKQLRIAHLDAKLSGSPTYILPVKQYPSEKKWLCAFLHNIPSDILGLMKILMLTQGPLNQQKQEQWNNTNIWRPLAQLKKQNQSKKSQLSVMPYSLLGPEKVFEHNGQFDIINNEQASNQIRIIFNGCERADKDYSKIFRYEKQDVKQRQIQNEQLKNKNNKDLVRFLKPPSDQDSARQHQVYASQYLKPKDMNILSYMGLCTTRAAQQTQILVLCSNILQRVIFIDCYLKNHVFEEQVFLQTAGHLSAYKFQVEKYFGEIRKLLQQFIFIWTYEDVKFCPVFGPFVGYIIRQLMDNNIEPDRVKQLKQMNWKLAQKCWQQFERKQQLFKQDPQVKIQKDQMFIITAALCCFRQIQLVNDDKKQILCLSKLIFQHRSCKLMSSLQKPEADKRQFQKQRNYSLEKALFHNINTISNFMSKKQNMFEITKLLRQNFDNSIPYEVTWKRNGIYQFIGQCQQNKSDKYKIDFYRGVLIKNGRQLEITNEKIRQNPNYIVIFGKERVLRVYPSKDPGYVRTKDDYSKLFKAQQQKYQIYLEFSEDGQNIRYIVREKNGRQQTWCLISWNQLKSSFHLPSYYIQNYFPWYCQEKHCIVLRKKQYGVISNIGMVIHLQGVSSKEIQIKKAFYVVYKNCDENQDLNQICSEDNKIYEQIILREKNQTLLSINTYKTLSKIQSPEYIFELRHQRTHVVHYLLHRYQLRFILKEGKLISENNYNYSIDNTYFDDVLCVFNKFPCLVLRKQEKNNSILLNSHEKILLISDGIIKKQGKIQKCSGVLQERDRVNMRLEFYKYDIHDFFGDIRGSNRESQLHLAALMLSIEQNIKMETVQMTPLEYAIYILRTCLTNRPLTQKQEDKVMNIIDLADEEVLILCQVIWKSSQKLKNILPFPQSNFQSKLSRKIQSLQKNLMECRTMYTKKADKSHTIYRKQIMLKMLSFIGLDLKPTKYSAKFSVGNSSSDSEGYQAHDYWRGIEKFTGKSYLEEMKQIQIQYNTVSLKAKNFQPQKLQIKKMKEQRAFPTQLQILSNRSQMMKELIAQLKDSYQKYCTEEQKIQDLIEYFDSQKQTKLKDLDELIKSSKECLSKISGMIEKIKAENESHPDIISGFRPTLCQACFTSLLCFQRQIYAYFPYMTQKVAEKFRLMIKIWMELRTRIASFERVEILLQNPNMDIVAILRQIRSPREQIFKNTQWVCFETEMKIQIWPSQFQIHKNLMKQTNKGPYCQLNMGEGKTQVVIPMIILSAIFKQKNCLPRVNLLSSLFIQARDNLFRFLSVTGFQIPSIEIPFSRKVQLTKNNILSIQDLVRHFGGRTYALVSRESRLSEILKYREEYLNNQIDLKPILKCNVLDIFDEVDAVMTPKKSTIYSIGNLAPQLPSFHIRYKILKQCLQKVLSLPSISKLSKNNLIANLTQTQAITIIQQGHYPINFRLKVDKQSNSNNHIREWKKIIAESILRDPTIQEYSFVFKMDKNQVDALIDYCIDPVVHSSKLSNKIAGGQEIKYIF